MEAAEKLSMLGSELEFKEVLEEALGGAKDAIFDCFICVILDIFSRYIVG